jgi:hypothetical protein
MLLGLFSTVVVLLAILFDLIVVVSTPLPGGF